MQDPKAFKSGKRKHAAPAVPLVCAALLLVAAALFAEGEPESGADRAAGGEARIVAWVSIPPQKYIVSRVGGGPTLVEGLIPAGADPHTYEPTARQMQALGRADVFFRIGIDFEEGFLPTLEANLPGLRIVDTREGVEMLSIERHADSAGDHGHEEPGHDGSALDPTDGMPDPHIWLSPARVKRQAQTVRDALIDLAPMHRETFEENYRTFAAEIDGIDAEIRSILEPVKGGTFSIYHPNLGYFAHDYGLIQEAVETGGREPTPQQLTRLIAQAIDEETKVIFVQPEFSREAAARLADAIDGVVVPLDTLNEDWPGMMLTIANRLREGLSR